MKNDFLQLVGNTPLVYLKNEEIPNFNLYVKCEYFNPTGSVKDRAANYILKKLLDSGEINKDTTIIESSSGNFGIALSSYCRSYGLKFCCVIDSNITSINEKLINTLSSSVIKISEPDSSGGYLLNRIRKVKELLETIDNSYWINQYANLYNAEAYYNTLGTELCNQVENIDYLFIGVSSGGTITGLSKKVKECFPNSKIIAVDVLGSVIFGGSPKKRYIPGMGSSMVPELLKYAKIDEVVIVDETSTINSCYELLNKYSIFVGGSSGSVFAAINKYFSNKKTNRNLDIVTVFPDRGERYLNTIYCKEWAEIVMAKDNMKNPCLNYL